MGERHGCTNDHRQAHRARAAIRNAGQSRDWYPDNGRKFCSGRCEGILSVGKWPDWHWPDSRARNGTPAAHRCRRASGDRFAGRLHVRQRDVIRTDPRRTCRHHRARRAANRCAWPSCELDDSRKDGAWHGWGHGLVTGAKRVIIAMQHTAKGKPKIVNKCTLPLTSERPVDLVVSELAVIGFPDGRATLLERAPGVSVEQVVAATEAKLAIPDKVPEMRL